MQPTTANTAEVTIPVSGLTCASCVGHVREALEEQPGVTAANVNLVTREAKVSFHPGDTSVETLVDAIRSRGYGAELPVVRASLAEEQAAQEEAQAEEYNELRRKAIASGALGRLPWFSPCP
jgi:P-type Cu+ transporter